MTCCRIEEAGYHIQDIDNSKFWVILNNNAHSTSMIAFEKPSLDLELRYVMLRKRIKFKMKCPEYKKKNSQTTRIRVGIINMEEKHLWVHLISAVTNAALQWPVHLLSSWCLRHLVLRKWKIKDTAL